MILVEPVALIALINDCKPVARHCTPPPNMGAGALAPPMLSYAVQLPPTAFGSGTTTLPPRTATPVTLSALS